MSHRDGYIPFLSNRGRSAELERRRQRSEDGNGDEEVEFAGLVSKDPNEQHGDSPRAKRFAFEWFRDTPLIFRDDKGRFYFRHRYSSGIEVPKRMALLMALGIAGESSRSRFERTDRAMRETNCHKTVLYLLGVISKDLFRQPFPITAEDPFLAKHASRLSQRPFVPCRDPRDVYRLADEACKPGDWCVGQVCRGSEVSHSFILGRAKRAYTVSGAPDNSSQAADKTYVVFETVGNDGPPTHITTLGDIITLPAKNDFSGRPYEYDGASWRFIPSSELGSVHITPQHQYR